MRLQILSVPDCPNVAVLRERLAAVLASPADVEVEEVLVDTVENATRAGMHGSPTLLVDGVDPFATAGQVPALACRLYRDEIGRAPGAPSVEQLRAALRKQ